jgi:alcohol dehydrogenase class IV
MTITEGTAVQTGSYTCTPLEKVIWGLPAPETARLELDRLDAKRVFVVASGTLSKKTSVIADLREALGDRFVGCFDACREHSPLESVIECVQAVGHAQPDLLLTLGGGSVIDTAKIAQLGLTHGVKDMAGLQTHIGVPSTAPSKVRQIVIPTTLSGSEFTNSAGSLDRERKLKVGFVAPDMCARVVILDPAIALHTPEALWLSTAIRSMDHAVESYCAIRANAFIKANTLQAVRLFFDSLPRTKQDPTDLEARVKSQQAVWLATCGLFRVSMGASHGISYLLGSVGGAPHGYTSCVTLPAVLRWNESVNASAQRELAAAIGAPDKPFWASLGELLDLLRLPRRISQIGVTAEMIPQIIEYALRNPVVAGNPRPVKSEGDVREILALASQASH